MLHCEETFSYKIKPISLDKRPFLNYLLPISCLLQGLNLPHWQPNCLFISHHLVELRYLDYLLFVLVLLVRPSHAVEVRIRHYGSQTRYLLEPSCVRVNLELILCDNQEGLFKLVIDTSIFYISTREPLQEPVSQLLHLWVMECVKT